MPHNLSAASVYGAARVIYNRRQKKINGAIEENKPRDRIK